VRALVVLNDPPYGTERSYNGLRFQAQSIGITGIPAFLLEDSRQVALQRSRVSTSHSTASTSNSRDWDDCASWRLGRGLEAAYTRLHVSAAFANEDGDGNACKSASFPS
jgi:sulfur relay (sulfurtransferase) complex TusBCD TusD component (DsrE family)